MRRPWLILLALLVLPQVVWAQTWPNQPTGSTLLTDNNLSALPNGPGSFVNNWTSRFPCNIHPNTDFPLNDPTARVSPPSGLHYRWTHNKGFGDSCVMEYYFPPNTTSMYIGVEWKASANYHGWDTGNQKIILIDATRNHYYITMYRHNGILTPPGRYQYSPSAFFATAGVNNCHVATGSSCDFVHMNVGSYGLVSLNVWHRVEVYFKAATCSTCQNGGLRYYWDGQMVANYQNLNTRHSDIQVVALHPVWDAFEPSCPTCVDSQWYDHVRVAIGGVPTGGGVIQPPVDNPPGPPGTVTGVTVTVQ